MRKILTTICALALAALIPAAILASRELPADTRPYVESKYAGWNGVLQAWVCSRWSAGGSFISWLNGCAADFEKAHEGVYIEFTPVDEAALRAMDESGIPRPDMVFFSPGVLESAEGLAAPGDAGPVREEFRDFDTCLPVAMGGYIWVYNRALCGGPSGALPAAMLPDDSGRCFSAAIIPLLEISSDEETKLPDAGLDLGLPASSNPQPMAVSEDALDSFINGETEFTPVTQKELARLIRLRDSGRGPDWECFAAGDFAWADQLLLAGVLRSTDEDAADIQALCREFISLLLAGDAQANLADIGAFSVTGGMIHPGHSAYAMLDALLAGRPLAVPPAFSEHSPRNSEAIIRAYGAGQFDAAEALAKMGLRFTLQTDPN